MREMTKPTKGSSSILKSIKGLVITSLITILLFLLIDFSFGHRLMAIAKPAEPFRTWHPVYHHTLRPNYDGLGHWGNQAYRVCTNAEGFKADCDNKQNGIKEFDIAFLGDSFTEGLGLPYEETFVGMVAKELPNLKIANLGVVSYSPAIYLVKLKELLKLGYRFKQIVVFVDISDPYDEAHRYDLHNDSIVVDRGEPFPLPIHSRLRRLALQKLPLTGEAYSQFRKALHSSNPDTKSQAIDAPPNAPNNVTRAPKAGSAHTTVPNNGKAEAVINWEDSIYQRNYAVGEWTYNTQSTNYGPKGVVGVLSQMEREMDELYKLAHSHGAKLSVGVYPWPSQLRFDVVDSLQVNTWRKFCETRCVQFYNAFPNFFTLVEQHGIKPVIEEYFIPGDVHFTKKGNAVIAKTILETGLK